MTIGAFNSLRILMTRADPIVCLMDLLLCSRKKKQQADHRDETMSSAAADTCVYICARQ